MKKGKRHGLGIEYVGCSNESLNYNLYKGAFYNNEKHGKNIIELIPTKNGNLKFEGSKWRGVSYGICKQFYENEKLMYEFDFGELKTGNKI